jgi:hypothetical protein
MFRTSLSIFSNFDQFTGFEHTRIVAMLTVLALISLIVWVIIAVSIIVCHITLLIIRLSRDHNHPSNEKEGIHAH